MNGIFKGILSLGDSLFITVIAMTIVFFILILIASILGLFKYIPQEKVLANNNLTKENNSEISNETKKFNPDDIKDENMIVAMLVASIEAANEDENAYIRVRNIKEI